MENMADSVLNESDVVNCPKIPLNSSNAIAILTSVADFSELPARLSRLDAQFLDNCSTSILLFHTGFPFRSEIKQMIDSTRRRIIFRNVDNLFATFPDGFDPYGNEPTFWKRGKWNYHHMIRFWFKLVFETSEVQSLEYIMRLDTDSRLIGKWTNVFDSMKANRLLYVANDERVEFEKILPGTLNLRKFFHRYKTEKNLSPKDTVKTQLAFREDGVLMYYNNFEVFKMSFFRQSLVQDWINAVDASHGIYKYRWGDAVLRYLTFALFAKDYEVVQRADLNLGYCHPC